MRADLRVAAELLALAAEQRRRLNFHAASILYRAARHVATAAAAPEVAASQADAVGNDVRRFAQAGSRIADDDAERLLRQAASIEHDSISSLEGESFADRIVRSAASAAAVIGEADALRLQGKASDAASLLENMAALLEAGGTAGSYVEAPCALQAFWLEAIGSIGGEEHGRGRL
jgi:hypothetical protein